MVERVPLEQHVAGRYVNLLHDKVRDLGAVAEPNGFVGADVRTVVPRQLELMRIRGVAVARDDAGHPPIVPVEDLVAIGPVLRAQVVSEHRLAAVAADIEIVQNALVGLVPQRASLARKDHRRRVAVGGAVAGPRADKHLVRARAVGRQAAHAGPDGVGAGDRAQTHVAHATAVAMGVRHQLRRIRMLPAPRHGLRDAEGEATAPTSTADWQGQRDGDVLVRRERRRGCEDRPLPAPQRPQHARVVPGL